jgi:hypothetical protein
MKRYKHDLSHYHLTTADMGIVYPLECVDVLPGDTFRGQSRFFLRVTPQSKPVMHPVYFQTYTFYVPNRILWSGWEDFITGVSATPPPTVAHGGNNTSHIYGYLGMYLDPGITGFDALPIRAYNMIWNEYIRDKDIQTEATEDSLLLQRVNWSKDYFTTSRPSPQQGDEVTLPLGTSAPITGLARFNQTYTTGPGNVYETDGSGTVSYANYRATSSDSLVVEEDPSNSGYPNIRADLSNATAVSIGDVREAMAMQRYKEARSRHGESYVDYLRYLGITPSDSRLQRPELISSSRSTISFSEVLSTSDTTSGSVGGFGGHGIGSMTTRRWTKFFQEHGWLITVGFARPKAVYSNSLPKRFVRTTKEDYYQRELEYIGDQEVYNHEVYSPHTSPYSVFGYAPQYDEYRAHPSFISGQMRDTSFQDWHLARQFTTDPALNSSFIQCDPGKLPFYDQTDHSLILFCNHSLKARRLVRKRPSTGKIV